MGVDNNLLLIHLNISNGNIEAHDFLHLKLYSRLNLVNFLLHVLTTGKKGRKLTSLRETRTKETGNLLDHIIRGEEKVIFLCKLLHEFLVLVQLLEVVDIHVIDANAISLFTMGSIAKHTTLDFGARDGRETECSRETLVALWIVVLESDLDLNGFSKIALFKGRNTEVYA